MESLDQELQQHLLLGYPLPYQDAQPVACLRITGLGSHGQTHSESCWARGWGRTGEVLGKLLSYPHFTQRFLALTCVLMAPGSVAILGCPCWQPWQCGAFCSGACVMLFCMSASLPATPREGLVLHFARHLIQSSPGALAYPLSVQLFIYVSMRLWVLISYFGLCSTLFWLL